MSRAALIPIDSSVVSVKSNHAGQEYSYSIHENKGFAIEPSSLAIIHNPFTKTAATSHEKEQHKSDSSHQTSDYAVTRIHVPLIQPYVYAHPQGYAYPYNLVALGSAWPAEPDLDWKETDLVVLKNSRSYENVKKEIK